MFKPLIFLLILQGIVHAIPSGPKIKLDSATVTGVTSGLVSKFLGIPYAVPPERFRAAQAVPPYKGNVDATKYGFLCPQQQIAIPQTGLEAITNIISTKPELRDAPGTENEDCLTINIIKPSVPSLSNHKLPVVVWIHGGAYQVGDTASYDSVGSGLVARSIQLGKPIIYVSINYRLSAYGFLGGLQIFQEGNGNLGLRDQRLAIQWVNKYIHAFGGDPSKVTLWGQSSGAISVGLQMMTNGGNAQGLFRAGFMMSGAPLPVGNITKGTGQSFFSFLASDTGCSAASDALACLRALPFPVLKASVDKTPSFFSYEVSLALVWHPSVDGVFLKDNPQALVTKGAFANIPLVSGTVDDEGTLFGISSLNITTDADFRSYVETNWQPRNPVDTLDQLWTLYPADPAAGSPFDTGKANALTPQFKRVSAFISDSIQNGPRRLFLQQATTKAKVFGYITKRLKSTDGIGSYHGSDLVAGIVNDNLIHFVSDLDPNTSVGVHWPQYTTRSPNLYTFPANGPPLITQDTFRADGINYLNNLALVAPFVL
ncbi:carotenoid ester lipase precursor [Gymnopilus junonius]|uniref:Carboxylic ester hydrolase n=1 Tax=Gymnopilus junonius TaxID=109634 RepID=A0A9P5TLI7_GYMJU|nr:carotenoid ester lipase precursor [Gymnopilus junonius]